MLSEVDLKKWLHNDHSRLDKCLFVLSTFETPCQINDIKQRAIAAGFKIPKSWNISAILGGSKGLAIRVPTGWELNETGKAHLHALGVSSISPAAVQVAADLRVYLDKITNENVRNFVEEAIKCYEGELFRSAIVMSWLAAIAVLQMYIIQNKLDDFNNEASRVDLKWKVAKTADDLGEMKEHTFLDRLQAISVIGKNTKAELQKALKLRNGCGHPSSLAVSRLITAAHLETLLLNVFNVFVII